MSFGWSACDIASAISLVYNIIEALDSCDGAANHYREAVGFLTDLKRTLEPLQTFTAWNAYPDYGKEIREQVVHIREPMEKFLQAVLKYEPSLGAKAAPGRHRHIVRKVQWHILMMKKVLGLKEKIMSHMRLIDTLLQRLTLDIVNETRKQIPQKLGAIFQDTVKPELLVFLENLRVHQDTHQETLISQLNEHRDSLVAAIDVVKQQLDGSTILQRQIASALQSPSLQQSIKNTLEAGATVDNQSNNVVSENRTLYATEDTLREVYYLVLLYLGQFLKNLFLVLAQQLQPSRALAPTLLAKHNISFLDAIGRPARLLPYEFFHDFKVLTAFINSEFKDLPGSSWVSRGDYNLLNFDTRRILTQSNWERLVSPGTTVAMTIEVRQIVDDCFHLDQIHCPTTNCLGLWKRACNCYWAACPICHKEVFTNFANDTTRFIEESESELGASDFVVRNAKVTLDDSKNTTEDTNNEQSASISTNVTIHKKDKISHFKRAGLETNFIQSPVSSSRQYGDAAPGQLETPSNASETPLKNRSRTSFSFSFDKTRSSISVGPWWRCCGCSREVNGDIFGIECPDCEHALCVSCTEMRDLPSRGWFGRDQWLVDMAMIHDRTGVGADPELRTDQ